MLRDCYMCGGQFASLGKRVNRCPPCRKYVWRKNKGLEVEARPTYTEAYAQYEEDFNPEGARRCIQCRAVKSRAEFVIAGAEQFLHKSCLSCRIVKTGRHQFGKKLSLFLRESQEFKCKICRAPESEVGTLHVDHDHKSLRVRGALCSRCNWTLGAVEDKPDLLNDMINYLASQSD